MGKVEELTKLIEAKHTEWKNLSINGLRDASGYKRWVAETVLKKYRSDKDRINKTSKKTKSNNKQNTQAKGEESSTSLLSKLSEEELEILIIEKLNKSLDNANIRLAIDFMKIKKTFNDLDQDLDIEKFLKKVNA